MTANAADSNCRRPLAAKFKFIGQFDYTAAANPFARPNICGWGVWPERESLEDCNAVAERMRGTAAESGNLSPSVLYPLESEGFR